MSKNIKLTDELYDSLSGVKQEFGCSSLSDALRVLLFRNRAEVHLIAKVEELIEGKLQGLGQVHQEVHLDDKKLSSKPKRTKQDILAEIRSTEAEYKNRVEFCQDVEEGVRLNKERDNIIKSLFDEINDLDSAGFLEN